jgi:hypothetical protein
VLGIFHALLVFLEFLEFQKCLGRGRCVVLARVGTSETARQCGVVGRAGYVACGAVLGDAAMRGLRRCVID